MSLQLIDTLFVGGPLDGTRRGIPSRGWSVPISDRPQPLNEDPQAPSTVTYEVYTYYAHPFTARDSDDVVWKIGRAHV